MRTDPRASRDPCKRMRPLTILTDGGRDAFVQTYGGNAKRETNCCAVRAFALALTLPFDAISGMFISKGLRQLGSGTICRPMLKNWQPGFLGTTMTEVPFGRVGLPSLHLADVVGMFSRGNFLVFTAGHVMYLSEGRVYDGFVSRDDKTVQELWIVTKASKAAN